MTWSEKTDYCRIKSSDLRTCETCVGRGTDCFWCGGKTKECLPFDWYYPGCNIKHVKYNVCWVSTSAVAIVIAVCAGIIGVLLIAGVCYCCCRWKEYNRIHKMAKAKKWNDKQEAARAEMAERHSIRSNQRRAELEAYRMKYGISPKESTTEKPKV
ncbi:unnamed protein product [Caenorhabditis bovis]|uniref:PSI domain-containing protein n=1 Tax=Caenorhabditis bovis TaxID=2654633 RepID=A0A8S1EAN2_9PELO|nr:unnamed protein product [Caenorhabditis bovis]